MIRHSIAASRMAPALVAALLALGCASTEEAPLAASMQMSEARGPRMVARSGDLAVSVGSPEEVAPRVEGLVEEAGGFVERSTATRDASVRLSCRVPAAQLAPVMDAVGALGVEMHRSVSAVDVTEEYTDLQTRLRNNAALRARLQQLLERADDVEEVLAVEKELNRIQSEIEIMQARFDRLKSEVELSALDVDLRRKRVLGPLGYVGYGFWWAFSKLFVIH